MATQKCIDVYITRVESTTFNCRPGGLGAVERPGVKRGGGLTTIFILQVHRTIDAITSSVTTCLNCDALMTSSVTSVAGRDDWQRCMPGNVIACAIQYVTQFQFKLRAAFVCTL